MKHQNRTTIGLLSIILLIVLAVEVPRAHVLLRSGPTQPSPTAATAAGYQTRPGFTMDIDNGGIRRCRYGADDVLRCVNYMPVPAP